MNTTAALIAIVATLVSGAEVFGAPVGDKQVVYVVTRCAGAESRALLSSRLIGLKADNLYWYDDSNVLRADLPKESLAELRADPEVILALPDQTPPGAAAPPPPSRQSAEQNPAPPPVASAPPPPPGALPQPAMPTPPMIPVMPPPSGFGAFAPPAMGSAPGMPAMGMGAGMAPMGILDSLAGMMFARMFNQPTSCRISVSDLSASFGAAGGDQVIVVKASGSCAWQAQASVPWIKITSGSGVSGSGIVSYLVSPTERKNRVGSISIVGAAGGSPIKGNATVVVMQKSE